MKIDEFVDGKASSWGRTVDLDLNVTQAMHV